VSASLDLDEVLGAIVHAATELFGGTPAWIWTADVAEQVIEVRAFSDSRLLGDYPVHRAAFNESLVGWVAAHRTMMEVPDVFVDPRFLRSATGWWQRHGLTSFVGMPIIQDGHLLGVLSFVSARPLRLGAEEREVLDTLVGQAALAMRNARLFAAAEEREREASALFDITRRLGATWTSMRFWTSWRRGPFGQWARRRLASFAGTRRASGWWWRARSTTLSSWPSRWRSARVRV
jgi:GAF domain-containing protein